MGDSSTPPRSPPTPIALTDAPSGARGPVRAARHARHLMRGSLEDGYQRLSHAAADVADHDPGRVAWLLASAGWPSTWPARAARATTTSARTRSPSGRAARPRRSSASCSAAGADRRPGRGRRAARAARPLVGGDRREGAGPRRAAPSRDRCSSRLGGALRRGLRVRRAPSASRPRERRDRRTCCARGRLEIDLRRGRWALARARTSKRCGSPRRPARSISARCRFRCSPGSRPAMGLEATCRAAAHELLGFAATAGMLTMGVYAEAALGLLELGLGHASARSSTSTRRRALCAEHGHRDPSIVPFGPDRVEALAARRRARSARTPRWPSSRPRPSACGARGRPPRRRAAAGCSKEDFEPWFARAYAAHGPDGVAVRARAHRGSATASGFGVRDGCARRGRGCARRWSASTRSAPHRGPRGRAAELRAAGGAVRSARTAATRELTPQELEVALAVAGGATNREVAAALYVSPKTVEVHLSRVFRKFDVRSRTELATLLAATK